MNRQFVPGFTIVEAIVSMVVTAIILSIIYVIFSIFSERLLDVKWQNEYINDVNRFSYAINKEIFESESMTIIGSAVKFKKYSGNTVNFLINEFSIARYDSSDFKDTFKLKVHKIHIDTLKSINKKDAYQRLKLNVGDGKQIQELNFYKKVYANELVMVMRKDEF